MDKDEEIKTLKARNLDLSKWLNSMNNQMQTAQRELIQNDGNIELLERQLKEEKPKGGKK